MRFSEDSLQKIKNIVAGFKNYPAYKIYDIASFCYDLKAGIQALRIKKWYVSKFVALFSGY